MILYDVLVDVLTVVILAAVFGFLIYEIVMIIKEKDIFEDE